MNVSVIRSIVTGVKARLFALHPSAYITAPSMTEDDLLKAWVIFEKHLLRAGYNDEERKLILRAFVVSFFAHIFAEKRKSGEPYFCHLYRCARKIARRQWRLRIKNPKAIIVALLHDAIEEVEKSNPFIVPYVTFLTHNTIVHYFGEEIATMVYWLSRKKHNGEGRIEHLERVARSELYEVIEGKLTDIEDNFDTLASMPLEKQKSKFVEAKEKLQELYARLDFLVVRGIENGTLVGEGWKYLVRDIKKSLGKSIRKQKERLALQDVFVK